MAAIATANILFKKVIIVDKFTNKDGKSCNVKRDIRFIDSLKFMASSLDKLVEILKKKAKSFTSKVTHGAGAYPGFCSVKWMRVFDSPWMGH